MSLTKPYRAATFIILLMVLLTVSAFSLRTANLSSATQASATTASATVMVSGTVSGPDGPVAGAWIGIGSPQDWQETHTNSNGFYSLAIMTDDQLWFHLRPDPPLAQINRWMDGVTGNLVQNFSVVAGHQITLKLVDDENTQVTVDVGLEIQPLANNLPEHHWYSLEWDEEQERHQATLPADIYYITVRRPPSGYYETTQAFDLRSADQDVVLTLNSNYIHPIPYDPPDANLITIGPAGDLGEATISGGPGAALPLAHVLLVNLNSSHQGHAISEADGSFSGRLFAPPGSAVLIKHGPAGHRWNQLDVGVAEGLNPYPGTIIHVPFSGERYGSDLPFAAAGFIDQFADDMPGSPNVVNSAWTLSGTIGPVVVDGRWTRVLSGTYAGETVPGLYLGGLNWTHPALADLDNDLDLDLVVGSEGGRLVLYRNLGTTAEPDWLFEADGYAGTKTDWWAYPVLVDVTGDDAADLFVGHGEGRVSIYYNDGTPAAPLWPALPDVSLSTGFNAAPTLANLDGDADLDLLVGHEGGALTFFRNTGTLANPTWTLQTTTYGDIDEGEGGLQPAFINLDGDGDLDLLVGKCGHFVWYERGGTAANPSWTRHDDDPIGYGGGSCGTSPGIGDWNGDGRPDVVTGEHWGNLRFFDDNSSTGWTEQFYSFPFEFLGDTAPALADWDQDGDLDMLAGQAHGSVYQYTNTGDKNNPNWQPDGPVDPLQLPWVNHPHPFPTFADINGDDTLELFVGEGGWGEPGEGGNIRYYQDVGAGPAPIWQLVTADFLGLDAGGWSAPVFADIDNDDDLDLFIGDEAGTLTFVENTGTRTTPAWTTPITNYAGLDLGSHSAPAFLDVDKDDDLDLLVGVENGSLAYVRNTGSVDEPAWELISTQYPGINVGHLATPTAADLNGDGDPDLLIGNGAGGLNLYLYEGPGTPPSPGDAYAPGDLFHINGTIRLHSQAITSTTDIENIRVDGWMNMIMLSDQDGDPLAAENYFLSTLLTPGGLPIQRNERSARDLGVHVTIDDLQVTRGHIITGQINVTGQIPHDVLPGMYRPVIFFDFQNVPAGNEWLAANVTQFTFSGREALLPPIKVGDVAPPRLVWRLLMDDFVQGIRGASAREDEGIFALTSQIVTQGAPLTVPAVDIRSGQPITYRLEPFMPRISFTDRRMPAPPLIPFHLPGGRLCVTIQKPDGRIQDLGCEAFAQSFIRTKTTRSGHDLNVGTVQMEDIYSLKTASDRFRVTFDQAGHHVISMTGIISDSWGNLYSGGGAYDLWVAYPLDIDPGVLPGTPLAVGDAFNPAMQFYPRVPAGVNLTVTHFPDSDLSQSKTFTMTGKANSFGYFSANGNPIILDAPGEIRVDVTAVYTDTDGDLFMGAMTWGGIVMTPSGQAQLVAHGRRGVDSLPAIPNVDWFKLQDLDTPPGAISHTLNPYFNGDILWSRMSDGPYGGDSLIMGASVGDKVGVIETAVRERADRRHLEIAPPGNLDQRFDKGEIPLFSSTRSGQPLQFILRQTGGEIPADVDQIAYSYRTSQRPGVRVREMVAEDGQSGGYWRLDTLYDDQLSVGLLGDQVNDYKFQYVGAVYRDLDSGRSEYLGQGSGWIFIPDDDAAGSRVMPPFAGYGPWPAGGGPILTLKGENIQLFILPTGTLPGAVLQVNDTFHFAGHLMPTLNSRVAVTVTAPGGAQYLGGGQANQVGYFYNPDDDFLVQEAGLWTVDVRVWHDGQIGTGQRVNCNPGDPFNPSSPCPAGDVLGSEDGRYVFYVAPETAPRLAITSPEPGFLSFDETVPPINISGPIPPDLSDVMVDYTITMPGYILERGQATIVDDKYSFAFDPAALHEDYPNLDLTGRDDWGPGLADTIAITLLVQGYDGSKWVIRTNSITIQDGQVLVYISPPPVADAGGPYLGDEGDAITLDGSGSTGAEDIVLYEWDCQDDGSVDVSSNQPDDSACIYGDNGSYTARLRATSAAGLSDSDTTSVQVANVPPNVSAGPDLSVGSGLPISLTGSFTDPGRLDTHTIEWDFDDGSTAAGILTPTHTYTKPGVYTVTLTVTDDDGGWDSDWVTVTVLNPRRLFLPAILKEKP